MLHDLRVATRLLLKNRAFTLTAGLTLAICIGANTALFSVVNGVLLRPLPVPEADRLMLMGNSYPNAGVPVGTNSGVPDYYDRLRETDVYEEQALYNSRNRSIDENGTPTRVRVMQATPSFFRLMRVPPVIGRAFTDQDGEVGNDQKVILSYALWKSEFGGDPQAIGRQIRVDGTPRTIVGVMPAGFLSYESPAVMLWAPLAFTPAQKSDENRHSNNYNHVGRLKPGATMKQAQAEIDALNARNLDRFPQYRQLLINSGFHTIVSPLQDVYVGDVKATLYLMWGGALFVLLIGCVNVTNLVLVRTRARAKELATRLAIGAGRLRVARQLIAESAVLTAASAAAGIFIGFAALRALAALNLDALPRASEIHLDAATVIYTLAIAAAIGLVLGLIPVASVLPVNLTTALRDEGRGGTSGRGAALLRRSLVVAQVAFAFVLLVGAGLLLASFRRVLAVDPGFNANGVLTATVSLPASRYADDAALRRFTDETLRRVRALPGVASAGATSTIPFGGGHDDSVILAEGYQMQPGESVISPNHVTVSPGYFEAMQVKLKQGRFFDDRDGVDAPKVVIVDDKLARHFWPNQNPLGRRLYFPTSINDLLAINEKTKFFTVVGVIGEVKLEAMAEKPAIGSYYFPIDQDPDHQITFALKTERDPTLLANTLRSVISQIDRELPVFDLQPMSELTARSVATKRSPMLLSLSFGAVALFLSAIGIYGVLAYLVTQRTREIGIRIALGSSAAAIFDLVLREGLILIAAGFAAGAAGAFALRKALETQLFGVSATDPLVLALVVGTLGIVALIACAVPARRATRIDPIVALTE